MNVALVHDWLVGQRGGENVLVELANLYPRAPIFTLVHEPGSVHADLESHRIETSFIQTLPGSPQHFRRYLPLFPRAIEQFDLGAFDLIVSSSHCVAKGVITTSRQRHVTYVHTPMRYVWDQLPQYVSSPLVPAARLASMPLRRWDTRSALRPDVIVTNSQFVARRIRDVWGRQAAVVYPPVDTEWFSQEAQDAGERRGYLIVSALVPYKGVHVAVQAATDHGWELTVIGDGSERRRLERLAGPTVRFEGPQSRERIRDAYRRARALFFCGVEDFGIVPLEATAAGCPVIALARGGALETVIDGVTGVLFDDPSSRTLAAAVDAFESKGGPDAFELEPMRAHADRFERSRFARQMKSIIDSASRTPQKSASA